MKIRIAWIAVALVCGNSPGALAAAPEVKLPPMKIRDEVRATPEELKAFRQRVGAALQYSALDPELAAILKKRAIVLDIVPDVGEELVSSLKADPVIQRAIKSKEFNVRGFSALDTAGVNPSARYAIFLDESLVTAPAMETVAVLNQQLVAIKMLVDGTSPESIGARQVKSYQLSIKSLEGILAKLASEPRNPAAVTKSMQRQIDAEKKTLAVWERLVAVTGK